MTTQTIHPPDASTGRFAVEAAGLIKQFGSVRVVDGIDLQISRGEIYGVLGPNGAAAGGY